MAETIKSLSKAAAKIGLAMFLLGSITVVKADQLIIGPALDEMIAQEAQKAAQMDVSGGTGVYQEEKKSAVSWGFDPVYEETYLNNDAERFAGNYGVETPKAATQFRFNFKTTLAPEAIDKYNP